MELFRAQEHQQFSSCQYLYFANRSIVIQFDLRKLGTFLVFPLRFQNLYPLQSSTSQFTSSSNLYDYSTPGWPFQTFPVQSPAVIAVYHSTPAKLLISIRTQVIQP